jgi:hypothetical protein
VSFLFLSSCRAEVMSFPTLSPVYETFYLSACFCLSFYSFVISSVLRPLLALDLQFICSQDCVVFLLFIICSFYNIFRLSCLRSDHRQFARTIPVTFSCVVLRWLCVRFFFRSVLWSLQQSFTLSCICNFQFPIMNNTDRPVVRSTEVGETVVALIK